MKKHVSQMSSNEIEYLEQRFRSVPQYKWKFNTYSRMRAQKRNVDMVTFRSIWTDGFDLVEYHKHEPTGENRVLLRSVMTDSSDNQVCAVFNFTKMEITTVYLNWRANKHCNLALDEYTSSVNVKRAFKAC